MAKVLIVSANLKDWTKNSGGKERTATLAEALSGHEVTFLSFDWNGGNINQKINKYITQVQLAVPVNIRKKYKELIKGFAEKNHDASFELLKDDLVFFKEKLKELSLSCDIVILDHFSITPLVVNNINNKPMVYNSHNCEITMAKQLYPKNKELLSIVEKMERDAVVNSVAVTYCSKKDFKDLELHYGKIKNSLYVPNGAVKQDEISYENRINSKNILFVGSGHPPNVEAAKKLISLAELMPSYNFLICGGAGNGVNEKNIPENYKVLGHVSDAELHKYFSKSFAFINPMDSGSGTHLKMMKALSYGIPIITSEVGARGFNNTEMNEAMIIAENNDDMINAIVGLKNNEKRYKSICNSAYQHSKTYDWEKIKNDYLVYVESFIKNVEVKKQNEKKEKVLICSIVRNEVNFVNKYYKRLVDIVRAFPNYEFYLSIYENDSDDGTKQNIMSKDWSIFNHVSVISENIFTKDYGSTKDEDRVKNLSIARNKMINGGGYINECDYVLVIDVDINFDMSVVKKILDFKNIEPEFDIVSATSIRRSNLYDQWATRIGPEYDPKIKDLFNEYRSESKYKKYYSTSNGFCLYRAEPFREGIKYDYINTVTGLPDCEMVVVCQKFQKKGYKNIFILHDAEVYHEHK